MVVARSWGEGRLRRSFVLFCFYFWLRWAFVAAHGLSLVAASGGYSSLRWADFSLWWPLLLGARALGVWASVVVVAGSEAQAQQLWCTSSVTLQHVGSSRTRDGTRVPCIGRRIPNHCATREVPRLRSYCLMGTEVLFGKIEK